MPGKLEESPATRKSATSSYDAVVIGAGIAGIYQLYRLREMGLSVRVMEAGSGVGGAWFWNRYPGARLDSESYTYGYFFSEEIQNEWSWSEEFVSQPELERYFNFVVDRLDLRRDIQLGTRVIGAEFDEENNSWIVDLEDGECVKCQFLISAVGLLSEPQMPLTPGLDDFQGESYHTALWPIDPVNLENKRVAVIGTGSSGVQLIPAISKVVGHMTVFQRTPNWCSPLNNRPISPERREELRNSYKDLHKHCLTTPGGFMHRPRPENGTDFTEDERFTLYESLWSEPGLTLYVKNYSDLMTNQETNDSVARFVAKKIRDRVHDPKIAEKLIPTDHGYGYKRPPLETQYYEVYNQDNVDLVDMSAEPLVRFTATGIETEKRNYEFDVIILATGFDAVTGAIVRMDVRGVNGVRLRDYWSNGPRTYLGIASHGFPNLFLPGGPQGATGNQPRSSEFQIDWIVSCLRFMLAHGHTRIEASAEAEKAWLEHVAQTIESSLRKDANSWYFGSNTPGKARAYLTYGGGFPGYQEKCKAAANAGYRGFTFSRAGEQPAVKRARG